MTWNVNSLAKEAFQRVHLIEARNSMFNFHLISICETSLNDSVELPATLLNDYIFVSGNNSETLDMVGKVSSTGILFLLSQKTLLYYLISKSCF